MANGSQISFLSMFYCISEFEAPKRTTSPINSYRHPPTMNAPKLPLDRHWIEQTLTPYLRYAFSHALPRDVDLTPTVKSAIAFCMHKAVSQLVTIHSKH
jgi:hypothetical protein